MYSVTNTPNGTAFCILNAFSLPRTVSVLIMASFALIPEIREATHCQEFIPISENAGSKHFELTCNILFSLENFNEKVKFERRYTATLASKITEKVRFIKSNALSQVFFICVEIFGIR